MLSADFQKKSFLQFSQCRLAVVIDQLWKEPFRP